MSTAFDPLSTDEPPELEEFSARPLSLIVVAVLFFLGGLLSILDVLMSLAEGNVNLDLGVLGVFIGIGLYRLRPGWRTCALVFTWMGLIIFPVVGVIFLFIPGPAQLDLPGQSTIDVPGFIGTAVCALLFAFCYWEYRVLNRPDIRALFEQTLHEERRLPPVED